MREKRAFKIHPHLLRDVIERQAGTVEKACLEGVMNSIEAGSSQVIVELDSHRIRIRDDGRGFQLQEELENFFETFGQPHSAAENKIWAEFRMGRGQMFAFGKNIWRTGTFRMSIDIRSMGDDLHYELESGLENFPGCEINIELYTPLNDREIYHTSNEIGRYVKYVEIPVSVNERIVSAPPGKAKWDTTTDDAFIRVSEAGRLVIYNLGVLVCELSQSKYGVAGIVVSRHRLKVNFARNDIISSCPVWNRIKNVLDRNGSERIKRKTSLTEGERESLIERFLSGEADPADYKRTKLFQDVTGNLWSMSAILKQGFTTWSVSPSFNRIGDLLIQQGTCLVLTESLLDLFGIRDEPNRLFERCHFGYKSQFRYVPFEEISKSVNDGAVDLPPKAYTPTEIVWLSILESMYLSMWQSAAYRRSRALQARVDIPRRKLKLGASEGSAAWTDGSTYITFSREFLQAHPFNDQHTGRARTGSIVRAAQVLAHEFCHEAEDCLTSLHGPEFDRAYRNMDEPIADAVIRGISLVTPKWRDDAMKRAKEQWRKLQGRGTTLEDATRADDEIAAMTIRQLLEPHQGENDENYGLLS